MRCSSTLLCIVLFCFLPLSSVFGQTKELTSVDRLAMLYTKQLNFTAEGEPLVRIRVADALQSVELSSTAPIYVLTQSSGGAQVKLPANKTYTISIRDAKAGTYQYAVILERFEVTEASKAQAALQKWHDAGLEAQLIDIGAIFALKGRMFDNRERLILGPSTENEAVVKAQREALQTRFNLDLDIHSELKTYPSARLILRDETQGLEIQNPDSLLLHTETKASIQLRNIPDESGKLRSEVRFSGQLVFSPDRFGTLAISNAAGLESILRGIVPLEIYPTAPQAALSAQAIAARGTIIAQIGRRHLADPYHVCNLQHCQVHGGIGAAKQSCDQAIAQSRGKILFYEGRIAQSYYSSHCGGFSASAQETWVITDLPYLQSLSDNEQHTPPPFNSDDAYASWWENDSPMYCSSAKGHKSYASMKSARWEVDFTAAEISRALQNAGKNLGKLQDVQILSRGPSFRVNKIRLTGTLGEFIVERELPIRRFFGGLRSALFVMQVVRGSNQDITGLHFKGAGFGHGVGMCQTGAMGMASRGFEAEAILLHYYPGTHVDKVW